MAHSEPLAPSSLRAPEILRARVLDVNISSYTVTVATEVGKKIFSDIPFATPYQHFVNGEGIYFMPEVGSVCWVCRGSDWNKPFVMAWGPMSDDKGHRGKKRDLNPGDIYLGTRDENFLILRRGGIVQIGGGPLSQRIFFQAENTIKDFCQNYELNTLGGSLVWSVGDGSERTDGEQPCLLHISAREKADDAASIADLKIGSHGEGSDTILKLVIRENGDSGAADKIVLSMGKDGSVNLTIEKDLTVSVAGKIKVEADGDISISSAQKMQLKGTSGFEAKGQTAKVEADTLVTLKGGTKASIEALQIALGGDEAVHNVLWGDILLPLLASHTHVVPVTAPFVTVTSGPPLNGSAYETAKSQLVKTK